MHFLKQLLMRHKSISFNFFQISGKTTKEPSAPSADGARKFEVSIKKGMRSSMISNIADMSNVENVRQFKCQCQYPISIMFIPPSM